MQGVYPVPRKPIIITPHPKQVKHSRAPMMVLVGSAAIIAVILVSVAALAMGVLVIVSSQRVLPGVSVAGMSLSGLSANDAAAQLKASLSSITVRDGSRTWQIPAAQLGLTVDANASAQAAVQQGRGDGGILAALFGHVAVAPVVALDVAKASSGIAALAQTVNLPAANATIRMVNGQLTPIVAVQGRSLNVNATVSGLRMNAGQQLSGGTLDLTMNVVAPTVTDATPLLAKTRTLLSSPLSVNAYDPITNKTTTWSVAPDQWSKWLTTQNTASGVALSLDQGALTGYLNGQNSTFNDERFMDVQKAVASLQSAVAAGQSSTTIHVQHKPTVYTIVSGDTIGTLSWKFGMPMYHIVNANPAVNMNALSVGQKINIPSKDDLLPLPVIDGKRIVISISQQHTWVYENGQVKWSWAVSTGIPDSPTMPGVFQVQSHDLNAYAGNWNLWMPHFMGIYDAVPGFTNGIHGMPTRSGYSILWENSLGTPVTYGCILLSNANAATLYNWAQDGVVVEIQR